MFRLFFYFLLVVGSGLSYADGIEPESSLILLNEKDNGATFKVTNKNPFDILLYVKVVDLPDDKQPQVLVTQPVVRVGAGQTQRVRFVLNAAAPLAVEHIKRVIFEGIAPRDPKGEKKIQFNLRHNIPMLIHPTGMPLVAEPWQDLKWQFNQGRLQVSNAGKSVVRLSQEITLLPANKKVELSKTYLLPGEVQTLDVPKLAQNTDKVKLTTLTKYGYLVGTVEQAVIH